MAAQSRQAFQPLARLQHSGADGHRLDTGDSQRLDDPISSGTNVRDRFGNGIRVDRRRLHRAGKDKSSLEILFCPSCACVLSWRGLRLQEDGRRRMAVNLRLAPPDLVHDLAIDHFDRLGHFRRPSFKRALCARSLVLTACHVSASGRMCSLTGHGRRLGYERCRTFRVPRSQVLRWHLTG